MKVAIDTKQGTINVEDEEEPASEHVIFEWAQTVTSVDWFMSLPQESPTLNFLEGHTYRIVEVRDGD